MKKIILVDGNNLVFRSYYATAAVGNLMVNSKGFPTNALFGLVNMLNKIIEEEKPEYMAVAFDVGKNFRHLKYDDYKAGRGPTPDELLMQLKKAKELLEAMGIKHLELENYEADDIIGTLSKRAYDDTNFDALIVSSDKDLLQLINEEVEVKLLKNKDYIRYSKEKFLEDYGINPIRMIDLKALMGDSSDNVPGVKGIGEKTALKLLQEYDSLENVYNNIDNIKGSLHDKLVLGKDMALFCKDICTICLDAPLEVSLEDLKYTGPINSKLVNIYKELEFYSFLKKMEVASFEEKIDFKVLNSLDELNKENKYSYYIECDNENYHDANILGMSIYDGNNLYFVNKDMVNDVIKYLTNNLIYTYDLKKNMCLLNNLDLKSSFDYMIGAYLLNYQVKDDLSVLMNKDGILIPFYSDLLKKRENIENILCLKAKYIYDNKDKILKELEEENELLLFNDVEMPLVKVLAKMELNGIKCDKNLLDSLQVDINKEIDEVKKKIFEVCGEEFNLNSPIQMGVVLFEHMGIPTKVKTTTKNPYTTDAESIMKACNYNPDLKYILTYRNLAKINNTYIDGLRPYIREDGKIHTIYKQALTRTGRLSSALPNMQNIPTRNDDGKLIKKAFNPEYDCFLSTDYSQIELRILAHMSDSKDLIDAFNNDVDIHRQVASDIFEVPFDDVTSKQRSMAKAVVFGIVYGISSFGLGDNLNISAKEAKKYIDKFYELYPGVKIFMENLVSDAYKNGYVRTLYNRKRVIDELFNKNRMIRISGERIAMNTPIQGTAADLLKMAMIKIDNEMTQRNLKSKMLLQVHDELVFDVVASEKECLTEIVKRCMMNVADLKVELKCSADFGKNWYETK